MSKLSDIDYLEHFVHSALLSLALFLLQRLQLSSQRTPLCIVLHYRQHRSEACIGEVTQDQHHWGARLHYPKFWAEAGYNGRKYSVETHRRCACKKEVGDI